MKLLSMPQMLLISGTGRNTGKTTFACSIINKFSKHRSIIAVKISPHVHKNNTEGKIVFREEEVYIEEELNPDAEKDSSRMLHAGAKRSFYIVASDDHLKRAFDKILSIVPDDVIFVCESGALRKLVVPGLFLVFDRSDNPTIKNGIETFRILADMWINVNEKEIDQLIDSIEINNNHWTLKNI